MKGVILAGGNGTRLYPLTKVTNKHLLPVYNKPMIYYPIERLVSAGIKDIIIVTGKENAGNFMNLLGSGKEFGVRFHYTLQDEADGIAHALSLVQGFVNDDNITVILGDNIILDDISEYVSNFTSAAIADVDLCEKEKEMAMLVNGYAVEWLSSLSKRIGAKFVQISTDYILNFH